MSALHVMMLTGSPRPAEESTSSALAASLARRLRAAGAEVAPPQRVTTLRHPTALARFTDALARADLLVILTPVYVDSLPAPLIECLQGVVAARGHRAPPLGVAAVAQCGFPESTHALPVLAQLRLFAHEAGAEWRGGLALGAGEALHGRDPDTAGGMARHVVAALDRAAPALARGAPVPPDAIDEMARPMMPAWLYRLVGSLGWRLEARRHHADAPLDARPLDRDDDLG